MHSTIGAIVYAQDASGAEYQAKDVFERLVGDGKPFDYFTFFPKGVMRANSKKGKATIDELMGYTKEIFLENLNHLKKALSKMSDEQAFSRAADWDVRGPARELGKIVGSGISLYDERAIGIRMAEDLEELLTKRTEPQGVLDWMPTGSWGISNDVWIVLADVHS